MNLIRALAVEVQAMRNASNYQWPLYLAFDALVERAPAFLASLEKP